MEAWRIGNETSQQREEREMASEESAGPAGHLEMLLEQAAQRGASDLHLSAGLAPAMRVDGEMRPFEAPPLRHEQLLGWLGGIMNDRQRREYEAELEADFSFQLGGVGRFRVNAFRQNRGAAAVFRAIPAAALSMAQLGMCTYMICLSLYLSHVPIRTHDWYFSPLEVQNGEKGSKTVIAVSVH